MSGLLEGGFLDEGEPVLGPVFLVHLQACDQTLLCIRKLFTLENDQ